MIYEAMRDRLLANATVKGLVAERVFRLRARQGTPRPFITIQQISKVPVTTLLGDANTYFTRYQVNCFADDPVENAALAAVVRSQLSGWQDSSDAKIRSDLLNEIDQVVETQGSEFGLSHIMQDYEINYAE